MAGRSAGSRLRRAIPDGASGDGLHLGKVTKVTTDGAFVELPNLSPGFAYGPCRYPSEYRDRTLAAGDHSHSTPDGGTSTNGSHTHQPRALAAGDAVLCGFLAGGHDDLVVIVRLT